MVAIPITRRSALLGSLATASAALLRPAAAHAADWKPRRSVEVVVGVAPGGSMDRTARALENALWKAGFIPRSSVVLNKPGGGHSIALAYTAGRSGDAQVIQAINTPLLTNKMLGHGTQTYTDVTPLANLFFEQQMFSVAKASPIGDGKDLMARIKADPSKLSFAVSSGIGTTNELAVLLLAKSLGVNAKSLKAVSFNSASEGVTSVLGGHVDVLVTTPFSTVPFMTSGDLRAIAIASTDRLGGAMADVPTWREMGADVQTPSFRVVVGPPQLTAEQIAFWDNALRQITTTPDWQKMMETEFLTPAYMDHTKVAAFLEGEAARYAAAYRASGIIA